MKLLLYLYFLLTDFHFIMKMAPLHSDMWQDMDIIQ